MSEESEQPGLPLENRLPQAIEIETSDFNWNSQEDIVVPHQQPVAIYRCRSGEIIIRQQDELHDEDREGIIWVQPCNLQAIIDKLIEIQKEICE